MPPHRPLVGGLKLVGFYEECPGCVGAHVGRKPAIKGRPEDNIEIDCSKGYLLQEIKRLVHTLKSIVAIFLRENTYIELLLVE
jgi:hypothetical protein